MSPAGAQQVPVAPDVERNLKQDIDANTKEDKFSSRQYTSANPSESYGPTAAALMSNVFRFMSGDELQKPPNWTPAPRDIGTCTSCNRALRCHHGQCGAYHGGLPAGHCTQCWSAANFHQGRRAGHSGRYAASSCSRGCRQDEITLSPTETIDKDLQAFNRAMVDVRTGKCCAKCTAKRAVKTLKADLIQIKIGYEGHRLSGHEKKAIKREVKAVAYEFKREIKQAWKASS